MVAPAGCGSPSPGRCTYHPRNFRQRPKLLLADEAAYTTTFRPPFVVLLLDLLLAAPDVELSVVLLPASEPLDT